MPLRHGGDLRESWCAEFAGCLLAARPSLSRREAVPIAQRFYDSAFHFEPDEAVRMALCSPLIRREDRGVWSEGDTQPGVFDSH